MPLALLRECSCSMLLLTRSKFSSTKFSTANIIDLLNLYNMYLLVLLLYLWAAPKEFV
jgi:hypothetical protein